MEEEEEEEDDDEFLLAPAVRRSVHCYLFLKPKKY